MSYVLSLQWPNFSVTLWGRFVNFWVKIDVLKLLFRGVKKAKLKFLFTFRFRFRFRFRFAVPQK